MGVAKRTGYGHQTSLLVAAKKMGAGSTPVKKEGKKMTVKKERGPQLYFYHVFFQLPDQPYQHKVFKTRKEVQDLFEKGEMAGCPYSVVKGREIPVEEKRSFKVG